PCRNLVPPCPAALRPFCVLCPPCTSVDGGVPTRGSGQAFRVPEEVTMELRLRLHHWEGRSPDLLAAAVAGFAAGAVLMVLELLWSAAVRSDALWRVPQ